MRPTAEPPATRRTVLRTLGVGLVGGTLADAAAGQERAPPVVVEQDGECFPVEPVPGDEPVGAFYDYGVARTRYSSAGTVGLQREEASLLFLYREAGGPLSLVVVHERLGGDGDGGSASFELVGLPRSGEWVVEDDRYDGDSQFDRWNHDGSRSTVDWTWQGGRTDGGAFEGLGTDFSISVRPGFGDEAALDGRFYDGTVRRWQFLSGDPSDPERVSLALDRPVTVRTGRCPGDGDGNGGTGEDDGPLSVGVDVLPSVVNPDRPGALPVVVRPGDGLAPGDLRRGSIEFGPGDAGPTKTSRVEHDGAPALLLHFRVPALDLDGEEDRLHLAARTRIGREVRGRASVVLRSPGRRDDDDDGRKAEPDDEDDRKAEREDGTEADEENEGEDGGRDGEDGEGGDDDETEVDEDDEDDGNRGNGRGEGRPDDPGDGTGRGNGGDDGRGRGNDRGRGRDRGDHEDDEDDGDGDDDAGEGDGAEADDEADGDEDD